MSREKRKVDPRIIMGICSGLAYLGGLGVQAYRFGWEDVPAYWLWAGGGAVLILLASAAYFRGRDRKMLREAIDRSTLRAQVARKPGGTDSSASDDREVQQP